MSANNSKCRSACENRSRILTVWRDIVAGGRPLRRHFARDGRLDLTNVIDISTGLNKVPNK